MITTIEELKKLINDCDVEYERLYLQVIQNSGSKIAEVRKVGAQINAVYNICKANNIDNATEEFITCLLYYMRETAIKWSTNK